jgi:hypothetical protein
MYIIFTSKTNEKHGKGILVLERTEVKKVETTYRIFSRVFTLVLFDFSLG